MTGYDDVCTLVSEQYGFLYDDPLAPVDGAEHQFIFHS